EVVRRVHGTHASGFSGALSLLYAADRPIAAHLGLRSRSVWHYWLPAYDPDFAQYTPGLILLLRMAEAASAMGVERLDLGNGDALYKRRLGSASTRLAAGSVDATRPAAIAESAARFTSRVLRRTPISRHADAFAARRAFA